MGRSLVTQKPIKQLQGLEKFFDIPPLFGNEKRASFFYLRQPCSICGILDQFEAGPTE